jgi:hypothetical protein
MLYRKSLYVLALNMAKSQRLDESSVADIHRQYGDHLYTKGDYDGAMAQFVKTIGWTQPSYVIRKVKYDCFIVIYIIIVNESTFLGGFTVPGRAAYPQPRHISPGTPFPRPRQRGSYHPPS